MKSASHGLPFSAPAARGVHGVFQVNNHFEAAVLQARDGFVRHAEVLVRRRLQREHHIQQTRFDHQHRDRNALLVAENELHVGPFAHLGSAPARSAKERQLHGLGVDGVESGRQVADKLVGARKTDFGIVHAKGRHALQKADSDGHGNLQVRLLQPVPKARVKDFDFSSGFRHSFVHPSLGVSVNSRLL